MNTHTIPEIVLIVGFCLLVIFVMVNLLVMTWMDKD